MAGERKKVVKKQQQAAETMTHKLERSGMRKKDARGTAYAALAKPKGDRKGGSGVGRQAHSGASAKKREVAGALRASTPLAARRVSAHQAGNPEREKPTSKRRSGKISEGE